MNTKLTLRTSDGMTRRAKAKASRRVTVVSSMTHELIESLLTGKGIQKEKLPPVTRSLVGVLKGHKLTEADYRQHLREKYL
jgi:hypothetical protein